MKKHILSTSLPLLLATTLTSCGSDNGAPYTLEFYTLYESPTEIYYELNLLDESEYYEGTYGAYEKDHSYNLAVFDKTTEEFSIIEDREAIDYKNIVNYTGSSSRKETRFMNSSTMNTQHLNNPIFYNRDTEVFFDIRTNEVVPISDECFDTHIVNYTCNILDNDIQVLLSTDEETNTYELSISNYVLNEHLASLTFTGDNINSELVTTILTYDNYNENKIGITVSYHTRTPKHAYYNAKNDDIETIVFEYSYDDNEIVELYRGLEYKDHNFNEPESCYKRGYEWIADTSLSAWWGGNSYAKYSIYNSCTDKTVLEVDKFNLELVDYVLSIYK